MSFINPITDFDFALSASSPKVADGIRDQIPDQESFSAYWHNMLTHLKKQIESSDDLDITDFQQEFLLTLLTNCQDNALLDGDEYKMIQKNLE